MSHLALNRSPPSFYIFYFRGRRKRKGSGVSDKPITSSHPNLREVSLVPPPLLQTSGRAQRAPRHPQLGEQASGEENTPLPLSFLLFSNKKTSNQALKKKKEPNSPAVHCKLPASTSRRSSRASPVLPCTLRPSRVCGWRRGRPRCSGRCRALLGGRHGCGETAKGSW